MSKPLPVIICGKTAAISDVVTQHLKPEYEVVKYVMSIAEGVAEIPPLLKEGKAVAVATGGGYDDAAVDEMRAAVSTDAKGVPWLRPDMTKPMPPLGPEYTKALVGRLREKLGEVLGDRRVGWEGVYWY